MIMVLVVQAIDRTFLAHLEANQFPKKKVEEDIYYDSMICLN